MPLAPTTRVGRYIWAFGCVWFEMLTGRRAFEGDGVTDTLSRVLQHAPEWTALPGRTRRLWQTLLEPSRSATSNTWHVGSGPTIRLVSATEDRIQTMVIRVAALDRAKAFLRGKQLLGAESDGQAAIDASKIGGLEIRLVGK